MAIQVLLRFCYSCLVMSLPQKACVGEGQWGCRVLVRELALRARPCGRLASQRCTGNWGPSESDSCNHCKGTS